MNSKVLKIITWILTIFNLCATLYYIKNSRKSSNKLRKMQNKLNSIKDDLNNITDELNDLTDELNEEFKKKDTKKEISNEFEEDIEDVADIDTTDKNLDEEE